MLIETIAATINRFSPGRRASIAEQITPIVPIETRHGTIRVYCPANPVAMRAESFLKKEPETLAWIDSLPGGVLWDVGANIGVYSLYAAKRGLRVFAFEPSPMNYAVLAKNIAINNVPIEAFCVALGDTTGLGHLNMRALQFGRADAGLHADEPLSVSALTYRMDDFPAPKPDFLKIDIDGAEETLVAGGHQTLGRAREVQIELSRQTYPEVAQAMTRFGFTHEVREPLRNVLFRR